MPSLPIADFLAGSLLTLLLPVTLLIALTVWYWWYSVRQPAAERSEPGAAPAATNPGPSVQQTLPPEPDA